MKDEEIIESIDEHVEKMMEQYRSMVLKFKLQMECIELFDSMLIFSRGLYFPEDNFNFKINCLSSIGMPTPF